MMKTKTKNHNYTQVSNSFLDNMSKYKPYEVVIFMAVFRKTIGWHKETDRISHSQFQKLTGLAVNTIKKGLNKLIKDGWINQKNGRNGYSYSLNIDNKVNQREVCHSATELKETISQCDIESEKTLSPCDTTKDITILLRKKRDKMTIEKSQSSSEDFIGKLINLFSEVYKEAKGIDYFVHKGKDRKAMGMLLSGYKQKNKEADSVKALRDFHNLFTASCNITDNTFLSNISISILNSQINQYLNHIRNGQTNKQCNRLSSNVVKGYDPRKNTWFTRIVEDYVQSERANGVGA